MKQFFKISFISMLLSISCARKADKSDSNYFSDLQFSVDTVIVDPVNEILFLKHQLLSADMGKDGKYIFNFNINDHTLEKINLDELRLEEKLPFEKEGPNGTGPFIGRIQVFNDNKITINGMNQSTLFSLDGQKLMTVYYENFSLGGHPMEGGEQVGQSAVLDSDANRLYGLIYRALDKSVVLGIFYLEEYEISKIEVKTFENFAYYTFTNSTVNLISTIMPEMKCEKFGTKVILSNQITSSLMWYDTKMDSLFIKSFDSKLTANEKVKDYALTHETDESFDDEFRRFHQEINFLPPFWDEKSQRFYRFSYQELTANNTEDGRMKSKVYLTILDRDLNQIGEAQVPQLTQKPGKHFAKDGKIWIYENMNDEMGFVRLEMARIN